MMDASVLDELASLDMGEAFMAKFIRQCLQDAAECLTGLEEDSAVGRWDQVREHAHALKARDGGLGVWLEAGEEIEEIVADLDHFQVIALNFPAFTDGRHCSSAYLLRNRYGYKGELRAIGDVLRDQLFSYQRVGFDAFALRADKDPVDALKAFEEFSEVYQASTDQPLPLFRRRA